MEMGEALLLEFDREMAEDTRAHHTERVLPMIRLRWFLNFGFFTLLCCLWSGVTVES
jgi:hypothetical protein